MGLDKTGAAEESLRVIEQLSLLQARLWAEHARSLLLVLQGLDASGKDGTIRRVFTGLNPAGCQVAAFKAPTARESDHDFLWRVHAALPERGDIGIFNRSHYEDIVTARVLGVIDETRRKRRVADVNQFERMLTDEGTTIVKVFLHVGKDEQRRRLQARLDDPEKRWKFRKEDLDVRAQWDKYLRLYDETITATSTEWAPWYIVPGDHKWVSGSVVSQLLVETLQAMDPKTPAPAEDLDGIVVE
jgi:PPK2 family polyphosphate:nucleotide phosphotransferase